jgi:hypothetical protein
VPAAGHGHESHVRTQCPLCKIVMCRERVIKGYNQLHMCTLPSGELPQAMWSLVSHMTATEPIDRPSAAQALAHTCFWSVRRQLAFVLALYADMRRRPCLLNTVYNHLPPLRWPAYRLKSLLARVPHVCAELVRLRRRLYTCVCSCVSVRTHVITEVDCGRCTCCWCWARRAGMLTTLYW